jgi:hypothetical protein
MGEEVSRLEVDRGTRCRLKKRWKDVRDDDRRHDLLPDRG